MGISVLVVEDDADFGIYLSDLLRGDGYRVTRASTAVEAKRAVVEDEPDLILLDLILPDSDGLILCGDLRTMTDAPIMICSATVRRRDAALALRLGADDFIAKPFDVDELRARIAALMRRGGASPSRPGAPARAPTDAARVGELVLDRASKRVSLGGVQIAVTPVELRLLAALMSQPGDILTRQDLVRMVWGNLPVSSDRAIDVHIRRIREKLSYAPVAAPAIVSVRGFGYKMLEPAGALV